MMKKLVYIGFVALLASCSGSVNHDEATENVDTLAQAPAMAHFGDEITIDGAMAMDQVLAQLAGHDSVHTKLVGTVEKVCQVKGCWMTMNVNENQGMHVSFKDYGFFVPKNIDGKEAIIEGYAYVDTMSVEELRHYAEDEGKSAEDIAAITEPETKLSFVAEGVIVKDYVIAKSNDAIEESEDHSHH
ncbi:MAG: DUF4920 domain-containing protein [Flavobacteriales bacterium]